MNIASRCSIPNFRIDVHGKRNGVQSVQFEGPIQIRTRLKRVRRLNLEDQKDLPL